MISRPSRLFAMFDDTNPKQGDSNWTLLAKIVQASGGTPRQGDTFNNLFAKWATAIS